jgi:hypothetical protein
VKPYRKPSKFAPRQDRWAVHKMNLYGPRNKQERIGFRKIRAQALGLNLSV